jgi:hypothetical protein
MEPDDLLCSRNARTQTNKGTLSTLPRKEEKN